MRNIFATFFVAFFIPVIVAHTIAAADVANGVRAYDAGWYDEALAEFLPAAEAGNVPAQMALASMYQFGEGVRQDDDKAAIWTRAAAERGDAVGQVNLSEFFAPGRGVALDTEQSYFWLFLAAGQGNSAAMAGLDTATASLTDAARRKIEQQVHNWAPFGNNLSGAPEVVDGETLIAAGQRLRLEGISAPAPGTRCQLRGNDQNCGRISTTALMDLTASAEVICRRRLAVGEDGSRFANCRAGGHNLSEGMVYTGWAEAGMKQVDVPQLKRYSALEKKARRAPRGMWRRE